MTDYEKVKQLLDDLGVEYEARENDTRYTEDQTGYEPCKTIICMEGMEKVSGYGGFIIDWDFNPDGSLKCVGAWE